MKIIIKMFERNTNSDKKLLIAYIKLYIHFTS